MKIYSELIHKLLQLGEDFNTACENRKGRVHLQEACPRLIRIIKSKQERPKLFQDCMYVINLVQYSSRLYWNILYSCREVDNIFGDLHSSGRYSYDTSRD